MVKKYDKIISLGETCSCSMVLRYLKLQNISYPLDWSGAWNADIAGTCGFLGKVHLIESHFKNAFNRDDFFETNDGIPNDHRFVKNSKTGLQYVHEFPWNISVDEHFPIFKEKYERRVKRFYTDIENSKGVLFVFIARWGGILSIDEIFQGCSILTKVFYSKKIDFLIFQKVDNIDIFDTKYLQLSQNINYIFYNDSPTTKNKNIGNLVVLRKEIMRYLKYQYIDFATDNILSVGLSHYEETGRWSDGKSCMLSLQLEDFIYGSAMLEFDINPYINNKHPILKVYIKSIINGTIDKTEEWIFKNGQQTITNFIISEKVTKTKQCNLIFNFDFPCSPFECGESEDRRQLGLFFRTIKISSCE